MEFEKRRRKNKSNNVGKIILIIIAAILGAAVIALAVLGVFHIVGSFDKIPETSSSLTSSVENLENNTSLINENYTFIDKSKSDINMGELILVNPSNLFLGNSSKIVNIYDNQTKSYSVSSYDNSAEKATVDAMNGMFDAFYAAKNHDDILIVSAYRTRELQQQLFDEGDANYVAKPGYSEHETGYAVDLGVYNYVDDYADDFTGEGDYSWINENAHKYGFILRYAQDKTTITGIAYEPWHFRYVGVPHSYYMYQNKLSFEEYINLLKSYTYDGQHLTINTDTAAYDVYYVPADLTALNTKVPIMKDKQYSISGNNVDGYIVTVNIGPAKADTSQTTQPINVPSAGETTATTSEKAAPQQ